MEKSIEHKYCEGKVKRTLIKELKELETTQFNQNIKRYRWKFRLWIILKTLTICHKDLKITFI